MSPQHFNPVADLRGTARLAVEGTVHVTALVEAMHATIAGLAGRLPGADTERTRGITGLVYRSVGGVTRAVGTGLELALGPLSRLTGSRETIAGRETALAILNGVLGDHLAATGNPLAIPMSLRHGGRSLPLEHDAIRAAVPAPATRVLLQVHGLCLHDGHWRRDGRDGCAETAAALGYTPLHLHYNTGLPIAANGRLLAERLEALVAAWPVPLESLAIVGHSMGGLVARSAAHHALASGQGWPARLRKLVFLGTPHHGAPLERAGNRFDRLLGITPYTLPFTRLGRLRSAGITDLRYGSLLEADWAEADRYGRVPPGQRVPVPLPAGVESYTVASLLGEGEDTPAGRLLGDGLVPLSSALGEHHEPRYALAFSADARWVGRGLGHLELMTAPQVLAELRRWLAG